VHDRQQSTQEAVNLTRSTTVNARHGLNIRLQGDSMPSEFTAADKIGVTDYVST